MPVNKKIARLSPPNYLGQQSYFVTICCDQRASRFQEPAIARRVITLLQESAASHPFLLHAFCFMADHAHLLVEGIHKRCDLREFIRLFKQRTSFEFRKQHGQPLWEMSYYDHILRPKDHLEEVACYIWGNPVRKGLCSQPCKFSFTGSQTMDWMKCSTASPVWHP